MKSKELRAKRAKLIEDARALISVDAPTAEATTKFDEMMAEADGLKAQIDRIERADTLASETNEALRNAADRNGTLPDQEREILAVEEGAFNAWMRRGPGALNEAQRVIYARSFEAPPDNGGNTPAGWRLSPGIRAAQGTTPDTAGGYTIPQGFYGQLIDAQKAYGGMVDVSFILDTTTGNALPIPTDNDTTNAGARLGENTTVANQDVTFGSITMNAYTYSSKMVLVSNQLLQDTAFNLDAFLSNKLGTRIARIVNTECTVGSGASMPTGVVSAATLGFTAGNVSGGVLTTTGSTVTISYDDLIELEHSVDPVYRKNARFMMSDTALKLVKKLKDGIGRPLWMPGLAMKEPDTINSFPYVINQDMAVPAASAKPVVFGDFANYYMRRVAGVQVLRLTERFADSNQVAFLAFQRWDGQLIDAGTHPVKYLQNSAS
jgi:HK97 family phage major capsid protein